MLSWSRVSLAYEREHPIRTRGGPLLFATASLNPGNYGRSNGAAPKAFQQLVGAAGSTRESIATARGSRQVDAPEHCNSSRERRGRDFGLLRWFGDRWGARMGGGEWSRFEGIGFPGRACGRQIRTANARMATLWVPREKTWTRPYSTLIVLLYIAIWHSNSTVPAASVGTWTVTG